MRYLPNPRFIPEFLRSRDSNEVVQETTEQIAEQVQAIADSIADTGDYARSLRVEDNKVVSDDPAAHIIEHGSINNEAFAPLRRGAEQVVGTENVR